MKHDLNCFDPNSIELCIFLRAVFQFRFIACFPIQEPLFEYFTKAVFSRQPQSEKNITDLFCFKCAHYKVLFVLFFLEEIHQASEVNIYLNVLKT